MKKIIRTSVVVSLVIILMTACGTTKNTTSQTTTDTKPKESSYVFVGRASDNASTAQSISSSIDFTIGDGSRDISVGGKLRMKRDQVIRINLVALGLMEVGVIEFTPSYVQIIDRIHTQYVKESYDKVDFLAKNGLTFYSLQALFWNELFYPGESKVTESVLRKFSASFRGNNDATINLKQGDMNYQWTAIQQNARITSADVTYISREYGTTSLHWTYSDFKNIAGKPFPHKQSFNLFSTAVANGQKATVTIEMENPEVGKSFDVTTTPSSKYKKVEAEDLIGQLLNM